jgi:aspartate/glutamate racemase
MTRFFSNLAKTLPTKKPRIGIIGPDPRLVATFNELLVDAGNKAGIKDDQQFPEMVSIGIKLPKTAAIQHFQSMAWFCSDLGCDLIVSPFEIEPAILSKMKEGIDPRIQLSSLEKNQNLTKLAEILTQTALDQNNFQQSRTEPIFFSANHVDSKEMDQVFSNLKKEQENIAIRIDRRLSGFGYPFLKEAKFLGVLGGAGPMASAMLCKKLADENLPFIHYSLSSAPGKHRFEMAEEGAPTYTKHYKYAINIFEQIKAPYLAIPCNTAHMRTSEYLDEYSGYFISYIETFLEHTNSQKESIGLIGTSRTTGVGLTNANLNEINQDGIYESCRKKLFPSHKNFILPTLEQQQATMKSIYLVKEGKMEEAKEIISDILVKMKKDNRLEYLKVGLVCTELPLPYKHLEIDPLELEGISLIDPSDLVVNKFETLTKEPKQKSNTERPSSNIKPRTRSASKLAEEKKSLGDNSEKAAIKTSENNLEKYQNIKIEISQKPSKIASSEYIYTISIENKIKNSSAKNSSPENPLTSKQKREILEKIKSEIYLGCSQGQINALDNIKSKRDRLVIHSADPEIEKNIQSFLEKIKKINPNFKVSEEQKTRSR